LEGDLDVAVEEGDAGEAAGGFGVLEIQGGELVVALAVGVVGAVADVDDAGAAELFAAAVQVLGGAPVHVHARTDEDFPEVGAAGGLDGREDAAFVVVVEDRDGDVGGGFASQAERFQELRAVPAEELELDDVRGLGHGHDLVEAAVEGLRPVHGDELVASSDAGRRRAGSVLNVSHVHASERQVRAPLDARGPHQRRHERLRHQVPVVHGALCFDEILQRLLRVRLRRRRIPTAHPPRRFLGSLCCDWRERPRGLDEEARGNDDHQTLLLTPPRHHHRPSSRACVRACVRACGQSARVAASLNYSALF